MNNDPWLEIREMIMKAAQSSLDEIVPEGGEFIDLDGEGLSINAEIFRVIWMRGVQLGTELMIMTLNLDDYKEIDREKRH